MTSHIAHTSVERLGSVSGGSRERDVRRVRGASRICDRARANYRKGPCELCPHGGDHQDQLTVVSSRLAALSKPSRASCQGVC